MVPEEDANPDSMRKKFVFGLPGNSVSSQVCSKMFVSSRKFDHMRILITSQCFQAYKQ